MRAAGGSFVAANQSRDAQGSWRGGESEGLIRVTQPPPPPSGALKGSSLMWGCGRALAIGRGAERKQPIQRAADSRLCLAGNDFHLDDLELRPP